MTSHWSSMYCTEGSISPSRQAAVTAAPIASAQARAAGRARLTNTVSRMCSPRRRATTAPSMASQRNIAEASSSDQVIGRRKT